MTTRCAPACSQVLPAKPQAVWARGIEAWAWSRDRRIWSKYQRQIYFDQASLATNILDDVNHRNLVVAILFSWVRNDIFSLKICVFSAILQSPFRALWLVDIENLRNFLGFTSVKARQMMQYQLPISGLFKPRQLCALGQLSLRLTTRHFKLLLGEGPGVGLSYELYGQGPKCHEKVKIVTTTLARNAVVLKPRGLDSKFAA